MTITQLTRESSVKRPTPRPVTSSVLDHAQAAGNVSTLQRFGLRNNEGLWPSYNCLDLWNTLPFNRCLTDDDPEPKTFDSAEWQGAFDFTVYGGVECQALGLDRADQEAEVARVFEASQGKGIERALRALRFTDPESDEDVPWGPLTDLTSGLSVPLTVALALLEGDAADSYVGLPTIHMPRAAATILEASGLIVWDGDLAFTKNGSRVAIGGGYDDPAMLSSGAWTMYATGEVVIEMSEAINMTEPVLPGMGGIEGLGLTENTIITLAERSFRAAVDCYAAKATGRAWAL